MDIYNQKYHAIQYRLVCTLKILHITSLLFRYLKIYMLERRVQKHDDTCVYVMLKLISIILRQASNAKQRTNQQWMK
ncbi:unnamed protein product [Paramecium primaurelia]|uniref:Uncharacterized protein n=1 Tax=Paramecium primaurelia TaxID=5886 RepID=A0A8S1PDJ9_PARPR|nr:unnamed protein product [Paramecium primaurelia]